MSKKEKKAITILILIAIVAVAALVISKNKGNDTPVKIASTNSNVMDNTSEEEPEEKFVEVLQDGTRLNVSSKLHETKTLEGIEFTDFQVTEKDNVSYILATMTNTTNKKIDLLPVDVTIVDENQNVIIKVQGLVGDLEPGESEQFNTNGTFDAANAYDFRIERHKSK